ncbi:hypothetical protein LJC38_07050 [Parabacteroides sp. OttesenSCG-928-K15]|nr:hypothetical protein [Parabacteroides sp. OttesenSCG-928-K15]
MKTIKKYITVLCGGLLFVILYCPEGTDKDNLKHFDLSIQCQSSVTGSYTYSLYKNGNPEKESRLLLNGDSTSPIEIKNIRSDDVLFLSIRK